MKFPKSALFVFLFYPFLVQAQMDSAQLVKLQAALDLITMQYVDSVQGRQLVDDAITGILKKLDPHSVYIPADKVERANEGLRGNFEGVGIEYLLLTDTIFVTGIIENGPAYKTGILTGDRIVMIDTEYVAGQNIGSTGVVNRLRGDKGTQVSVGVLRNNEETLRHFVIQRDKVSLNSVVSHYMIDSITGYIRINRFSASTLTDFKSTLITMRKKGLKNLVLDLQNNSGGYLNSAVGLCDDLLGAGKKIVYTEGAHQKREDYNSSVGGIFEKGKLIVLINEGSASASEIVAGALQDNDRALLIGRKSYGKGLVQKPSNLTDGSQIRLTIARYYTPSGRCIQRPYQQNEEAYFKEFNRRLQSGELMYLDSIPLHDSLRYFTSRGRSVYAAGGIIPDIFIPYDTSQNSAWFSKCQRSNLFSLYCLHLLNRERDNMLNTYSGIDAYASGFEVSKQMLDDFYLFAGSKKIEPDKKGMKQSRTKTEETIKSTLADYLWDTNAYYRVFNDTDPTYLKAVELMQEPDFTKYGIY